MESVERGLVAEKIYLWRRRGQTSIAPCLTLNILDKKMIPILVIIIPLD